MNSKRRSFAACVIAAALLAGGCGGGRDAPRSAGSGEPVAESNRPGAVSVEDISGSRYFDAVHAALRAATQSVFIAMFEMRLDPARKNSPQYRLVGDLADAAGRRVDVDAWLDRSELGDTDDGTPGIHDTSDHAAGILRRAGAKVEMVGPPGRLHAKVIVIDGGIVIEGSANWTYSALRRNVESATLIRSASYARVKKARILEELSRNAARRGR